jgi:DNA-binding XRE family transcriptional regulator
MSCAREGESVAVPRRAPQTKVRTRLAACRAAAGLTQMEMAWAIGVPIASYVRLERGEHKNPPLGWLVNAAIILEHDLDDVMDDSMHEWYDFDRSKPPSPEWRRRPEVLARAARWLEHEERDQ